MNVQELLARSTAAAEVAREEQAEARREARAQKRREVNLATAMGAEDPDAALGAEINEAIEQYAELITARKTFEGNLKVSKGDVEAEALARQGLELVKDEVGRLETEFGNGAILALFAEIAASPVGAGHCLRICCQAVKVEVAEELSSEVGEAHIEGLKAARKSGEYLRGAAGRPCWRLVDSIGNRKAYFRPVWVAVNSSAPESKRMLALVRVFQARFGDLEYRTRSARSEKFDELNVLRARATASLEGFLSGNATDGVVALTGFTEESPWRFFRQGDEAGKPSGTAYGSVFAQIRGARKFSLVFPELSWRLAKSASSLGLVEEGIDKILAFDGGSFGNLRVVGSGQPIRNPKVARAFLCQAAGLNKEASSEPEASAEPTPAATAIAQAIANPRGKRESRSKKGRTK